MKIIRFGIISNLLIKKYFSGVLDVFRSNPCKKPAAAGDAEKTCFAMQEKWYHNDESKQCEQFVYGGCGGNRNRFDTKEECEKRCMQ